MNLHLNKHIILIMSILALLGFSQAGCGNDDDDDNSTDDTDTDTGTGTGTEVLEGCEAIEWGDPEVYMVNGGMAANWSQSAYMDTNESGTIDEDEHVDLDFTLMDLCESEKQSLLLLIATDN